MATPATTTSYSASVVVGKYTYVFFNETDKKTKKPTIQFFRIEGSDAQRDTIRINGAAVETQSGPIAAAVFTDGKTKAINIRVYYISNHKIVEVGLNDAATNKIWQSNDMAATGIEVAPGSLLIAIGQSSLKELTALSTDAMDKDALIRIYYNSKAYADMVTASTCNGQTGQWKPQELEE
ncbi:hypothetical protein VTL71DRAFT_10179 [Oculimacula yallundae]|uniref:Fucose-specific lectin n=1 Tax=Oculimacula yallundae TaxID=86028 RepID=A0ABR4BPV5_9HELO